MKRLILFLLIGFIAVIPSLGNSATLFEGFESGVVPPSGWTVVQNNAETWKIMSAGSPYSGFHCADVEYSEDLQSEWLLSPVITPMAGPFTVEAWSMGSLYWGRDTYDNYDLLLILVYGNLGGGDEVYVGKLDDDWTATWAWSQSTFDLAGLFTPGTPVRLGFHYVGADGAQAGLDNITIQYTSNTVPEPAAMLLLGLGLAGIAGLKRRMK
jgi:hypothetical protein